MANTALALAPPSWVSKYREWVRTLKDEASALHHGRMLRSYICDAPTEAGDLGITAERDTVQGRLKQLAGLELNLVEKKHHEALNVIKNTPQLGTSYVPEVQLTFYWRVQN